MKLWKMKINEFAILNWKRNRKGKLHISFIIDFFFGKDFCMIKWIEWRLKNA
jgi:hypothetical protein